MKRALYLLIGLLALTAVPAQAATITLDTHSPVTVGSAFDVLVQVDDAFAGRPLDDLIVAFGFNITVDDGSIFQYTGETVGPLFDDFTFPGGPMVAGLASSFGIGPADFSGPLTLATLHFSALNPGTTAIGVIWDSTDLDQGLIYADLPYGPISASTRVTATATVPEPGTVLLLGAALGLGLLVSATKRW